MFKSLTHPYLLVFLQLLSIPFYIMILLFAAIVLAVFFSFGIFFILIKNFCQWLWVKLLGEEVCEPQIVQLIEYPDDDVELDDFEKAIA